MSRRSSPKMPDHVHLKAELEDSGHWERMLVIELEGAMTAPIRNGQPTMEAAWAAEVWSVKLTDRRDRRFLGKFVSQPDETPADLLRFLATLYEQGNVPVSGTGA